MQIGKIYLDLMGGGRSLRKPLGRERFNCKLSTFGGVGGVGGENRITSDLVRNAFETGETIKANVGMINRNTHLHLFNFGESFEQNIKVMSTWTRQPDSQQEIKIIEIWGPDSHPSATGVFVDDIRKTASLISVLIANNQLNDATSELMKERSPHLAAHIIIEIEKAREFPLEVWRLMQRTGSEGVIFAGQVGDLREKWIPKEIKRPSQAQTSAPAAPLYDLKNIDSRDLMEVLSAVKRGAHDLAARTLRDLYFTEEATANILLFVEKKYGRTTVDKTLKALGNLFDDRRVIKIREAINERREAAGRAEPMSPETGLALDVALQKLKDTQPELDALTRTVEGLQAEMEKRSPRSIEELIRDGDLKAAAATMIKDNLAPGMVERYFKKDDPEMRKRAFVAELDALAGNDQYRQKTAAVMALLLLKEERPELEIKISPPSLTKPLKPAGAEDYLYRINDAVKKGQFTSAAKALREAYDSHYKAGKESISWLAGLLKDLSVKEKLRVLTALHGNLERPEAAQEIVDWIDQERKGEKEKRS